MSQGLVSRVVFVYTRATFAASSSVHVGIDTWVIEYVKYTTDHFVYGEHNINNSLGQPITTLVEHSKAGVTKKNSSAITPFVVCLATIALYFNWLTNKSTMYYQNNIIHWSMSWMLLFPRNKMSDERTCLLTSLALSEIFYTIVRSLIDGHGKQLISLDLQNLTHSYFDSFLIS